MPTLALHYMALLLAVPVVVGGGCATVKGYGVTEHERILTAAGFRIDSADMPDLQQGRLSMPPHQLISRIKDGNVVYMYADPDNCHCVYMSI